MRSIGFILAHLATPHGRRSLRIVGGMLVVLTVLVCIYSAVFHVLMEREGQSHSWPTAVYWTVVTMSTLGFGDITFESDLGRAFSVVVLLSGSLFILVLLPFTFIQFVFLPWMESTRRARAPRRLPNDIEGHVLLTGFGPIEAALVPRLTRAGIRYASVVSDVEEALRLHDDGIAVLVGDLDDPRLFRAANVDSAALVAATQSDTSNTNIAFTVREISDRPAIVATASSSASVDILELAGCDGVLQLGEMLGQAMARRVLVPDGCAHVVGEVAGLLIAEAAPPRSLVGVPLAGSRLRERTGATVAGIWDRGVLSVARPTSELRPSSMLVLAGSQEQLDRYNALFGVDLSIEHPIVIIGAGRVGRAAGAALGAAGLDYRIVERRPERIRGDGHYVDGDAAELEVLERAGIRSTTSVLVTTHDDDMNVYLTIYCRRLRPDVQIISRANLPRNVSTLHRAGADAVLSYATTGADAIWNQLSGGARLQLAEGMAVFRAPVPAPLVGQTLEGSRLREWTGCTVVAVLDDGQLHPNPDPRQPLQPGSDLVLIGDDVAEQRFAARYGEPRRPTTPERPGVMPAQGG